jgi:hypothetical protein
VLALDAEFGRQKARELNRIKLEKQRLEEVRCLVLLRAFSSFSLWLTYPVQLLRCVALRCVALPSCLQTDQSRIA